MRAAIGSLARPGDTSPSVPGIGRQIFDASLTAARTGAHSGAINPLHTHPGAEANQAFILNRRGNRHDVGSALGHERTQNQLLGSTSICPDVPGSSAPLKIHCVAFLTPVPNKKIKLRWRKTRVRPCRFPRRGIFPSRLKSDPTQEYFATSFGRQASRAR